MLLSSPKTQETRDTFTYLMVDRLLTEKGLALFVDGNESSTGQAARDALLQTVIAPAIRLQEKFICSIDKYTVESDVANSSLQWDASIYNNVGVGGKRLDLPKLRQEYSEEVIEQNLKVICIQAPALKVCKIRNFGLGRPRIVSRQEVLVAWSTPGEASPEEGPVLAEEDRGLMWLLFRKYHPALPQTRVEDGSEDKYSSQEEEES